MAKVLVSIEESLLQRIDGAAKRLGLSRSAYLAQAAQKELDGEKGPGARPEAREAIDAIRELVEKHGAGPPEDSTDVIRQMRDSR